MLVVPRTTRMNSTVAHKHRTSTSPSLLPDSPPDSPVSELLERNACRESLAADADALEDAVAAQLFEHKHRHYLTGLEKQTIDTSSITMRMLQWETRSEAVLYRNVL